MLNKRALTKHLQATDHWMRELFGWLWHRRGNTLLREQMREVAMEIKRGEKLLANLKKKGQK